MIWITVIFFVALVIIGVIILLKFEPIEDEIKLPYQLKRYFFSRSEQEFLSILNEAIDKSKYTIFPKVRLADFVEVKANKEEYQKWWNKIMSKHVDFLVWDVKGNKIALAIELDGKSHSSEKMVASDTFKDELYTVIEVPLHRVKVGYDFKVEAKKLVQTLKSD